MLDRPSGVTSTIADVTKGRVGGEDGGGGGRGRTCLNFSSLGSESGSLLSG
jgi:hypothetical protein